MTGLSAGLKRGYDFCACGAVKKAVSYQCRPCRTRERRAGKFDKTCPFCGVAFVAYDSRLVYCSKQCSDDNLRSTRRGEGNPNWNPETTRSNGNLRARRWVELQPCEVCGSIKSERHHKDGDPRNNERANIRFLCRRHHMIEDGRMERWLEQNASRSKTA